jgi:hypothetical protein
MTRQPAKLAVGPGLKAWWDLRREGLHPSACSPFGLVIDIDSAADVVAKVGAARLLIAPEMDKPALIGYPLDAWDGDN